MKKTNIIEKIKLLFTEDTTEDTNVETTNESFVDVKTTDARILRVTDLAVDQTIEEVTADGVIALEDGTYELEDGMQLVVVGGIITEIVDAPVDEPVDEPVVEDIPATFSSVIKEVHRWELNVSADTIELGTELKYVDTLSGDEYDLVDSGEYELEDGRKIQVDSLGIVVLIDGASNETMETETETETSNEDVNEEFKELVNEFKSMKSELETLKNENIQLKTQVETFAKAPSEEQTNTTINFKAQTKEDKLKFFGTKK